MQLLLVQLATLFTEPVFLYIHMAEMAVHVGPSSGAQGQSQMGALSGRGLAITRQGGPPSHVRVLLPHLCLKKPSITASWDHINPLLLHDAWEAGNIQFFPLWEQHREWARAVAQEAEAAAIDVARTAGALAGLPRGSELLNTRRGKHSCIWAPATYPAQLNHHAASWVKRLHLRVHGFQY